MMYGMKDGSKKGWLEGGKGKNKTSVCRYKKNMKAYEDGEVAEKTSNKVIKNILNK